MESSFEKAKRIQKETAMKEAADTTVEMPTQNVTEEHTLSTTELPSTPSRFEGGVPIGGLTELPVSMLTLPYCVITQALSDVYLADGKTPAAKGKWYFTDTKTTEDELSFITLRAKVIQKEQVGDNGETKTVSKLRVLCVNVTTSELFIFSLPVSSFNAWGSMMAQLKKIGVKNSYEYVVTATIQSATNKKGQKYFIANFVIGDKLNKNDLESMKEKLGVYGGAIDTVVSEEE